MADVHPAPETLHRIDSHRIDVHRIDVHRIDVHQHLWPGELLEALRARREAPRLEGWNLILGGEPPFDVHPADHDPAGRRAQDSGRVVLGLSSPLGIEDLPVAAAEPLLEAWHQGVARLGGQFDAWASVNHPEPDLDGLRIRLADGFVGLQISALQLATPGTLERSAGILRVCESAGKPVFVHPGPVAGPAGEVRRSAAAAANERLPSWWAAVVDYPSQLQAAWWAWQAAGRQLLPDLRICFAAGAGLGPVHHERFLARGGRPLVSDPGVFVDTSSYSRQGLDSLIRALGIDPIVIGSDRPYGTPAEPDLGEAAALAIRHTNPLRLLEGTRS